MGCAAAAQVAPNEDHCGAWGGAQKDRAGDVLLCQIGRDPPGEDYLDEEPCKPEHGERFDHPIDYESNDQPLGMTSGPLDASEVYLNHHGVDHEPDQDRDRYGNVGILPSAQSLGKPGQLKAYEHSKHYASCDPHSQVPLKETESTATAHDPHLRVERIYGYITILP